MFKGVEFETGNEIRPGTEQIQQSPHDAGVGVPVYRTVMGLFPEIRWHPFIGFKVFFSVDAQQVQFNLVGKKPSCHVINGNAAAIVRRVRRFIAYLKNAKQEFCV